MATRTETASMREADLTRIITDGKLRKDVVGQSLHNIRRAYSVSGKNFSHEEVGESAETAIKLGYYRALAYRFLREVVQVDPPEWLLSQRVNPTSPARDGKDRSHDLTIVSSSFPAFTEFVPSTPLTDHEITRAAGEEMYDIHRAPGSDYHQTGMFVNKSATSAKGFSQKFTHTVSAPGEWRSGVVTKTSTVSETTIHASSLDPSVSSCAFTNWQGDTFGPVILRVARHLTAVFGTVPTLYWVWDKMFFHGDYAHLLRVFGGDEIEKNDKLAFDALRKDLARKLRSMDEELENLRNDLGLQMAHEAI